MAMGIGAVGIRSSFWSQGDGGAHPKKKQRREQVALFESRHGQSFLWKGVKLNLKEDVKLNVNVKVCRGVEWTFW